MFRAGYIGQLNSRPTSYPLDLQTNEDDPVSIKLISSDVENDPLVYEITQQASFGNLSGQLPFLEYTPNANFYGVDSFAFKVSDGFLESSECDLCCSRFG